LSEPGFTGLKDEQDCSQSVQAVVRRHICKDWCTLSARIACKQGLLAVLPESFLAPDPCTDKGGDVYLQGLCLLRKD